MGVAAVARPAGGTSGPITISGTGLANVTGVDPAFNVSVLPPAFIGAGGVTVSGVWPNITITGPGILPPGGVNSVTGSTKILIAGTPSDPIVQLKTSGVIAATYNGVTFDVYGTITATDPLYVPILTTLSTSPTLTITTAPGPTARTFNIASAAIGTEGTVVLSPATAAGSNNPADVVTAVTPAGVHAVLAAYVPPGAAVVTVLSSSSYTPDVPANYTNNLASTITVPVLATGDSFIVDICAEALDTATPTLPPIWGLAVFHGLTIVQGIQAIPTGSHRIQFVLMGPLGAQPLALKTTALTGTTNVVAQSITGVFLPGP